MAGRCVWRALAVERKALIYYPTFARGQGCEAVLRNPQCCLRRAPFSYPNPVVARGQSVTRDGKSPGQPTSYAEKANTMPTVRVKENEPFEVAMRRFKRTVEKTGLLTELRAREFYEKPTAERKRKRAAAVKRHFKRIRSQQLPPRMY